MKDITTIVLLAILCFSCKNGLENGISGSGTLSETTAVTTFAGNGSEGRTNGTATASSFNSPTDVAIDDSGNLYVADSYNDVIRKIDTAGVVTTFAGSGFTGSMNGTTATATFRRPYSIAVDASGNVYVADTENHLIRKISLSGNVTTLAGSGNANSTNGTGTAASFAYPSGIATDIAGNVYVADSSNDLIRKITPAGVVTTFAGSGDEGSANGMASEASFNHPSGIAVDESGNVYVADAGNNLIRKISTSGVVSTFAGSGNEGSADGAGIAASFNSPIGITADNSGNIYVAETANHLIRKINPMGVVITLAGNGLEGFKNGKGSEASFSYPSGIAVDSSGNVFVADQSNNLIRKIVQ